MNVPSGNGEEEVRSDFLLFSVCVCIFKPSVGTTLKGGKKNVTLLHIYFLNILVRHNVLHLGNTSVAVLDIIN